MGGFKKHSKIFVDQIDFPSIPKSPEDPILTKKIRRRQIFENMSKKCVFRHFSGKI